MHLIIGGRNQGQLEYAVEQSAPNPQIADLGKCSLNDACGEEILMNIHLAVKNMLENGDDPVKEFEKALAELNEKILVGDEIGSGIVPANPFERKWRDETGRVYVMLSRHAERVDRIWAGCVQTLKGRRHE